MWKKGISGLLWGLAIVMVYSVLFGRTISGYETRVNKTVSVMAGEEAHFIVIDSGHGFFDAGKIGVSGALEKDINLAIALKLKADLESQGFHVRMTRENDVQLYDGMRPSDKKEDMQKRVYWLSASIRTALQKKNTGVLRSFIMDRQNAAEGLQRLSSRH